ncbi:MAG: FHA domain-containing protein [Acidobacteria bacterium]|nr:FHA domain-containing protein [Acidobacteriota bacterium]
MALSTQNTATPGSTNQTQTIPANDNRKINVILVGYDIENNPVAQQQLEEISKAVQAGGGQAQVLLAGHDRVQLQQAMSQAVNIATGKRVPTSGGGGGGYVTGYRETDMTAVLVIVILLSCALMVALILIVRNRRMQTAGGPRIAGAAALPIAGTMDILYNDGGYKSFSLRKPVSRFGRSSSSDFVLHDDEISGTHAELHVRSEGYFIRDLGSSNGTFVNGEQVTEAWVKPGDEIQMGNTKITLKNS